MTKPVLFIFFGGLLLIFLVYLGFRFETLIKGPQVEITSPQNGEFLKNTHLQVGGEGRNVSSLKLNGRPIYTNEEGFFEEKLILAPGLNIIKLEALGRFGLRLVKERQVMVKLPE